MSDAPAMRDLLGADAPSNWGKWGPDDELGCLNYLDTKEVLRGVAAPLKVVNGTGAPVNPIAIR